MFLRLCKEGYGPTPRDIEEKMNAREVIQALYYESFLSDYEQAFVQVNKEEE